MIVVSSRLPAVGSTTSSRTFGSLKRAVKTIDLHEPEPTPPCKTCCIQVNLEVVEPIYRPQQELRAPLLPLPSFSGSDTDDVELPDVIVASDHAEAKPTHDGPVPLSARLYGLADVLRPRSCPPQQPDLVCPFGVQDLMLLALKMNQTNTARCKSAVGIQSGTMEKRHQAVVIELLL